MPHFGNAHIKVKCPKGDLIDGAKEEYHYDMAYEYLKDKKLKAILSLAQSPIKRVWTGILPFYCKKHQLLFLYDFDNQKVVSGSEDMELLKKVKKAMLLHPNYEGKKIRIHP